MDEVASVSPRRRALVVAVALAVVLAAAATVAAVAGLGRGGAPGTGAARVDLVGYSAGGIVVRALLADPARALRARRVVLLGAPNHGTDLAGTALALDPGACTGSCPQMAPGSSL